MLNRLLDAAFSIHSTDVLNDGSAETYTGVNLAAELKHALDALLGEAYDARTGRMDYARVRASAGYRDLRLCAAQLNAFDLRALARRAEQIAFWLNLYNALVVNAVIEFGVRQSVMKDFGFFRRAAYCIGGLRFSADDIEHGILRGNRRHPLFFIRPFARNDPRAAFALQPLDPRVHAALNCASRSCPPIAVYDASQLDAQLDRAMRAFVNATTRVDPARGIVETSPIFRWYAGDFGGRAGVLDWIAHALSDPSAKKWLDSRGNVRIQYSRYDWKLNGQTIGEI